MNTTTLVFRPRSSLGWLSLVVIAAIVLGLLVIVPLATRTPIGGFTIAIGGVIGGYLLLEAVFFPTMRYELDDHTLYLRYGPLLNYRIPLEDIQTMRRKNLSPSVVSSMRLPGIALGRVAYTDEGTVKMVATRAATDVLLLDTHQGKFGITPQDEAGLVQAIKERKSR